MTKTDSQRAALTDEALFAEVTKLVVDYCPTQSINRAQAASLADELSRRAQGVFVAHNESADTALARCAEYCDYTATLTEYLAGE